MRRLKAWLAGGGGGRATEVALHAAAALARMLHRLRGPGTGIALVYHRVSDGAGDPARELVPATPAHLFEAQVGHLVRHYRVVTARELPAAARARRRGARIPVALTFDDDYPSHVEHVAPVLRRAGAPATFFLCGAALDSPRSFWWERLQRVLDSDGAGMPRLDGVPEVDWRAEHPVRDLGQAIEALSKPDRAAASEALRAAAPDPPDAGLRRSQVAELARQGFEIGFHTRDHDPLDTLDDAELRVALRDGREALETAAGGRLETIAYPHGRFDGRTAAATAEAGFATGYTLSGEPMLTGTDRLLVGRFEPRWRSLGTFALKLATATWRQP